MKIDSFIVNKKEKGYTLIELLIYMGIFSIIISVLGALFGATIDTQLESQGDSYVDQDGKYILSRIIYDFQSASSIDDPTALELGVQHNSLRLTIDGETYTYSLDANGNLELINAVSPDNLNSIHTKVSDLRFIRIGSGSTQDTVKIHFTITSKIPKENGYESRDYDTTLSLP